MDGSVAAGDEDGIAAARDGLVGELGTAARTVDGVLTGLDTCLPEGGEGVAHNGFAVG